jgi:hypothetical protein
MRSYPTYASSRKYSLLIFKMNRTFLNKNFRAMASSNTRFFIFFASRTLIAGIALSTLMSSSSALAQNQGFAGDWTGTITVRPPGQDEIKRYTVILKLGELTKTPRQFDDYYHQILAAKITTKGSSNYVNLDLNYLPFNGQFAATNAPRGLIYKSMYLIHDARERKDGGKLSKAFPDCMDNLELGKLNINSAGNFVEGEVYCDNDPKIFNSNTGTVTLQRVGSAGTSVKSSPNSNNPPEYKLNDVFLPKQSTPTQQAPSNRPSVDRAKDSVPGILRNIFR